MSNPDLTPEYDDWLPDDFKPLTFKQLMWQKLKSAPLVGVGAAATVFSFAMASYYSRLANSKKLNIWLRWRVASQSATVMSAIYYGGVALTPEKQNEYNKKQLVLLGELPTNTPIRHVENKIQWWSPDNESPEEKAYRESVLASARPIQSSPVSDEADENAKYYPLPMSERMQAAEFAARLRAAEKAHEAEQAVKKSGLQPTNSAGDLLAKRMERAYANRPEGAVDKKVKVANKHKLKKEADAEAARAQAELDADDEETKF